jgi:hypothetical protein
MHDTFGNALVIEVLDFLEKDVIFKERTAAFAGSQRVFIIGDDSASLSRHGRMCSAGKLMQFAPVTG